MSRIQPMLRVLVTAVMASNLAWADTPEQEETFDEVMARSVRAVESAPERPPVHHLLTGGTVMTATGNVWSPGAVLIEDGKITWVGPASDAPQTDAVVVDTTGRWVTPGIIDTHSHLGVYPSPSVRAHSDGNEATRPVTAEVFAEHGIWVQDPGFQRAVQGGITALQILPGSANLIGGRGVVIRPTPAMGGRAMRFPGAPETLKMACGENPKRVYGNGGGPSTRMGNVAGQRGAFVRAARYHQKWQAHDEALAHNRAQSNPKKHRDVPEPPDRDLSLETLAGVIDGSVLPQIHCYRSDDMLAMMQIADEFGFRIRSFHHAIEAYKIRDLLAGADISVSTWSDWWGFKMEAYDAVLENAALVHESGARTVIHSDSAIGIQRLNQEAGKAYYDGLAVGIEITEDEALGWITANAAWALGIHEQTGTVEAGKRADLVIWSEHPFSVYAMADRVYIDGAIWHDAEVNERWSDHEVGMEVQR